MNIYVLLKKTLDTEEKIVIADGQIEDDSAEFIINPYDGYGGEEAIDEQNAQGGACAAVSVGDEDTDAEWRRAVAMGGRRAGLINTRDYREHGDNVTTAKLWETFCEDKEGH